MWRSCSVVIYEYTFVSARDGIRRYLQAVIAAELIRVEKCFCHNTSTMHLHTHQRCICMYICIGKGWNQMVATGTYYGGMDSCGEVFLSQYINGQVTNLTLRGRHR